MADTQADPAFVTFKDMTWGVRALAVTLITYQDKYEIHDISGTISRWAPPNENDTNAYIAAVCRSTGFSRFDTLDYHTYQHLRPVVEAIIRHECGLGPFSTINTWVSNEVIDTGLARAGVVKPAPVAAAMPVTKETVGATATGAVGVAQLADAAPAVMTAMQTSEGHLTSGSIVRIAFGVATVMLAAYIAWAQLKKHQAGTLP